MAWPERKTILITAAVIAAAVVLTAAGGAIFHDVENWRSALESHLTAARGTPWALPLVVGLYVAAGVILFPVSVLNLSCAVVFGIPGILYSIAGSMANVAVYFGVGRLLQRKYGKRLLANPKMKKVDETLNHAGISGVVGVHVLPVPPYTIVNLAAGLTTIRFYIFFLGSLFALAPGSIARGIFGDSLVKVLLNPTMEAYLYLALGLALWAGFIAATHIAVKKFQPAPA